MLMAYHSQAPTAPLNSPQGQDVGTLIYFCTLREALLDHFLIETLKFQKVPVSLIEKLLEDNKLANQKFGGLFTSATGLKWEDAITRISKGSNIPFKTVSQLMRSAAELRNTFLHEGAAWAITRELSTECMNAVPNMVDLFVALHNEFSRRPPPSDA